VGGTVGPNNNWRQNIFPSAIFPFSQYFAEGSCNAVLQIEKKEIPTVHSSSLERTAIAKSKYEARHVSLLKRQLHETFKLWFFLISRLYLHIKICIIFGTQFAKISAFLTT
jgi:hypothetical protein